MTEYTLLLLDHDERGTGFCLVPDGTPIPDVVAIDRWTFSSAMPHKRLASSLGQLAVWVAGSRSAGYGVDIDSIVDRWIDLNGDGDSTAMTDKRATICEVMY